jgi:Trk-type K+ transport system membrane component
MPEVKVFVRKRRHKKISIESIIRNVKIMLIIMFFSVIAGWAALLLANFVNPPSKMMIPLNEASKNDNNKIITRYKDKYGEKWKEKAIEDYQSYIK